MREMMTRSTDGGISTSLLTGRYNYRTGVVDTYLGRAMMHPDEVTLAEMLAAAGYRTAIFGKWHLGDNYPMRPTDQGFQEGALGTRRERVEGEHAGSVRVVARGVEVEVPRRVIGLRPVRHHDQRWGGVREREQTLQQLQSLHEQIHNLLGSDADDSADQ